MPKSQKRIISLFSGSGGLDLGFESAGFEVAIAFDKFASAIETYNSNRDSNVAVLSDVTELTGENIFRQYSERHGKFDAVGIIGGPPCQAFSRSNVYPKKDDIRRTLPGHFARILQEVNRYHRISFFVFENVQGLTFERHKEEFERFRFLFEDAGYQIYETLLNAKDFCVPQDRPRVFIVGIDMNLLDLDQKDYQFPKSIENRISVKESFSRVFGNKPWPEPAFFSRDLSISDIPFHPNHWTMRPKSEKFHNGTLKEGEIKGRSFRVLSWDRPSWTVAYGHREIHVHPSGRRRLSIFEAMILQGFPQHYILKGTLSDQVKLVSDAVPPPLAYEIARSILHFFEHEIGSKSVVRIT